MNASPAMVFAQWLQDVSIGVSPINAPLSDWAAWAAQMPDDDKSADRAIAVFDTLGTSDGRIHKTGKSVVHPGIQFRIRADEYHEAWSKSEEITAALDAIVRTVVVVPEGTYTIQAATRGNILALGPEPEIRRRMNFTINVLATLEKN